MSDFTRPTRSQLITNAYNDLNGRIPGADSRLRRSTLNGIAAMHAGACDGMYGYLDYIADQIMPDTADSDHLARWASFWGIFPKLASAATGTAAGAAAVGAPDGTDVPEGTVLLRSDGFAYVTTADATVEGGVVTPAIAASTPGSAGSALAGVILTLASPIAGVNSQFTVSADMNGSDPETNAELLGRLEARIQNAPKGGGPGDYVAWALSQPGVTRAWEYPLWMGLGTVQVFFVYDGRPDIFPLAADITAMQAYLDSVAPVTAIVTAQAPQILTVDFQIQLTPSTAAVQAAVAAELADLFTREGAPSAAILKSHYDQAISFAAGETDHDVVSPAGDIDPGAGFLPVLGEITWL
jgi:uncharacterized phage protein gp47/JayE